MLNFGGTNVLDIDESIIQEDKNFLVIGENCTHLYLQLLNTGKALLIKDLSDLKDFSHTQESAFLNIDLIILDIDHQESDLSDYLGILNSKKHQLCQLIGITKGDVGMSTSKAIKLGLNDLYHISDSSQLIVNRVRLSERFRSTSSNFVDKDNNTIEFKNQISFRKRTFDVVFASLTLLIASPIMLLICVMIVLESRGPIFFISQRAGTGFKVFNFYKFRSMKTGSESKLAQLLRYNQYENETAGASFFKIRNDPRVTKVGWLLRKTSLDELPQLLNVLKGDMSIVGNRPLPLYEAKSLTKDEIVKRFFAPAGITGLWQVSKRGKKDMSIDERLALNVSYVDRRNGWYDLGIICKTLPAMIQKEAV